MALLLILNLACAKKIQEPPRNYGTLDALFDQQGDFLIVIGTNGFETEKEVLIKWANLLKEELRNRGRKSSIVDDKDLDFKSSQNMHLLLMGRPESNSLLKEYSKKFPVYVWFGSDMFQMGDKVTRTVFGNGAQISLALPNPENPEYMMGIFSLIFEQEVENMYWKAALLGENVDYVMWQPRKGPTMGAGFVLFGMFQEIFSKQEFLSNVDLIKARTLKKYRNSSLIKLERIKKVAHEVQIKHPRPIIKPEQLKRNIMTKDVKTFCHYSPILDYMFLLFTNSSWRGVNFQRLLPLPTQTGKFGPITLPEYGAVDDLSRYFQLYSLAEMYDSSIETERMLTHGRRAPSYNEIENMLKEGESTYPEFVELWKMYIEPIEQRMTERWEQDLLLTKPIIYLQRLTGLQWPTDEIHLCISVFHPSGSALTTDPFVFTCFFNEEELLPDAAWVLGHEGTHILLNSKEAEWKETEQGKAVIEKWGGGAEEAICLLMQNRLSWVCGFINEEEIQKFDPEGSSKPARLAHLMNKQWDLYLDNVEKYPTIIDFMIEIALSNSSEQVEEQN